MGSNLFATYRTDTDNGHSLSDITCPPHGIFGVLAGGALVLCAVSLVDVYDALWHVATWHALPTRLTCAGSRGFGCSEAVLTFADPHRKSIRQLGLK